MVLSTNEVGHNDKLKKLLIVDYDLSLIKTIESFTPSFDNQWV